MKRKVVLPLLVILSLTLITPVVAVAEPMETYHYEAKVAAAWWRLRGGVTVRVVAFERMKDFPSGSPDKMMTLRFSMLVGGSWRTISKELAPNEFRWSYGACRVSTKMTIRGVENILTVEWDTVPPTQVRRSSGERDDYSYKGRTEWRDATATLMWGDRQINGDSVRARVYHTTITFYGGHPLIR